MPQWGHFWRHIFADDGIPRCDRRASWRLLMDVGCPFARCALHIVYIVSWLPNPARLSHTFSPSLLETGLNWDIKSTRNKHIARGFAA